MNRLKNNKCTPDEISEIRRLFTVMKQTLDVIYKAREIELKQYGVTPEQAGALASIAILGDKATPSEIAKFMFREYNSVSVLLKRMEKLGMIRMTKKSTHSRKDPIKISITDKGNEVRMHATEFQSIRDILCILPKRKREQLYRLTEAIRQEGFRYFRLDINEYSGQVNN